MQFTIPRADCPKLGSVFPFHLKSSLRFWKQILKLHFYHFNISIIWQFYETFVTWRKMQSTFWEKYLSFPVWSRLRSILFFFVDQNNRLIKHSFYVDTQLFIFLIIPLWAKRVGRQQIELKKKSAYPVYGVIRICLSVCLCVCLSVCLLQTLSPIISALAKQTFLWDPWSTKNVI